MERKRGAVGKPAPPVLPLHPAVVVTKKAPYGVFFTLPFFLFMIKFIYVIAQTVVL